MNLSIQSNEARKALKVAQREHWGFRLYQPDFIVNTPTYQDGWWFVPIEQDKSIIPKGALERVATLKRCGVKIKKVVVAHEAPALLAQPKVVRQPVEKKSTNWSSIFSTIGTILGIMLYLPLALLVDPALIVVLEDGTWVEVMRWYE